MRSAPALFAHSRVQSLSKEGVDCRPGSEAVNIRLIIEKLSGPVGGIESGTLLSFFLLFQ